MFLIEDMEGVLIFSVTENKNTDAYNFSPIDDIIICQLKQIIVSKDDINLSTFGVSPFNSSFFLEEKGDKEEFFNYIIRFRNAHILFKDIALAKEYFNRILTHFFPDIKKLEVKEYFKV